MCLPSTSLYVSVSLSVWFSLFVCLCVFQLSLSLCVCVRARASPPLPACVYARARLPSPLCLCMCVFLLFSLSMCIIVFVATCVTLSLHVYIVGEERTLFHCSNSIFIYFIPISYNVNDRRANKRICLLNHFETSPKTPFTVRSSRSYRLLGVTRVGLPPTPERINATISCSNTWPIKPYRCCRDGRAPRHSGGGCTESKNRLKFHQSEMGNLMKAVPLVSTFNKQRGRAVWKI